MNGSGGASEFTLSEGLGKSSSSAALSQTETTITVNWSGGGQIKPGKIFAFFSSFRFAFFHSSILTWIQTQRNGH
jgi:hypothetical protein